MSPEGVIEAVDASGDGVFGPGAGLPSGRPDQLEARIAARRAIADEVRLPLAKLSEDDRAFIDALLARTLARAEVLAAVREHFPPGTQRRL